VRFHIRQTRPISQQFRAGPVSRTDRYSTPPWSMSRLKDPRCE
jgi:hypothetical protein